MQPFWHTIHVYSFLIEMIRVHRPLLEPSAGICIRLLLLLTCPSSSVDHPALFLRNGPLHRIESKRTRYIFKTKTSKNTHFFSTEAALSRLLTKSYRSQVTVRSHTHLWQLQSLFDQQFTSLTSKLPEPSYVFVGCEAKKRDQFCFLTAQCAKTAPSSSKKTKEQVQKGAQQTSRKKEQQSTPHTISTQQVALWAQLLYRTILLVCLGFVTCILTEATGKFWFQLLQNCILSEQNSFKRIF